MPEWFVAASAGSTVIAAIVTRPRRQPYPEVFDVPEYIELEGTVICGQLVTIDKDRLRDHRGELHSSDVLTLNDALRAALAID